MKSTDTAVQLLCPSAPPKTEGSVAFGVVAGSAEAPRLLHFAEPLPVTEKLLALSGPVAPAAVFRFAAPCAGRGCQHFDGRDCRLATRIVQILPAVTSSLPPCRLRADCRWWKQEGRAACLRCSQIVSECVNPSEEMERAAG